MKYLEDTRSKTKSAGHKLSIISLSGEELIRSKIIGPRTTIDIGTLKSGVYFVRLTNDKTVKVGMFIKQ